MSFKRFGLILLCALLAIGLMVSAPPVASAAYDYMASDENSGEIRVALRTLGQVNALEITLVGHYSVDGDPGFRFSKGTVVTLAVNGGDIYLSVGGLTINMGSGFTLTRHESDTEGGMYIHGTEKDNLYNGHLRLSADGGLLTPIFITDIEEYLYGVVPYEMSDSFPIEALKAQAVAARTYALSRMKRNAGREYHVVDTTQDQVFKGFDPKCENAIRAVNETRGVCGMYNGDYATCFYGASNGGQTALANDTWGGTTSDYDYLDIRDDPYDLENPSSMEKRLSVSADGSALAEPLKTMLLSQIYEALAAQGYSDEAGDVKIDSIVAVEPHTPKFNNGSRMYTLVRFDMRVSARPMLAVTAPPTPEPTLPPEGDESPAPDETETLGPDETEQPTPEPTPESTPEIIGFEPGEFEQVEQIFSADITVFTQLKQELGLKLNGSDYELASVETFFAEDGTPKSFDIIMRRYGHGVGMSQRGAEWMAGSYGMSYTEILGFYYPGMSVETRSLSRGGILSSMSSLPSSLGAARPRPTPRPTQAPLPALTDGEYYATVTLSSSASALNVRAEPSTDAERVTMLYPGERVVVMGHPVEGWAHIKTAEFTGYVSVDFIVAD